MAYYQPEQRLDYVLSNSDDKNYIKSKIRVFLHLNEYIKYYLTNIKWSSNKEVKIKLYVGGDDSDGGTYETSVVTLVDLLNHFTFKNTVPTFKTALENDLNGSGYKVITEIHKGPTELGSVTNIIEEDEDIEVEG